MRQSEIYVLDVLNKLDSLAPIKISLNGIVLYNDYDSPIQIGDSEMYGETAPWQDVISSRLWQLKEYTITDIKVQIVEHHHSIISMKGFYNPYSTREAKSE